jgi:SOS-response transcriptional repressor LexA
MRSNYVEHLLEQYQPARPSARRLKVLSELSAYRDRNGYSPTVRELALGLRFNSHSSVHSHLDGLTRDGLLSRRRGSARSWQLTSKGEQALRHFQRAG